MIETKFPIVNLSSILQPVKRSETPLPGIEYRQIGVRLWGGGAYEREPLDGGRTRYKTLFRVEEGDVIVNKIWARNGSVAVVPRALAGCYVSSEFPIFTPDATHLLPQWFHWITKTRWFWEQCDEKSRGTSGKNRIRPEKFLEVEIPLPPLEEQRRIVARIEALAEKIAAARQLRQEAVEEVDKLLLAAYHQIFNFRNGWDAYKVGDICEKPQYGYTASAQSEPVGPKFLRITDIQNGKVQWRKVPYCVCANPEKYLLQPGDIVFARTGGTTGKSFLINECPDTVFASYLIRLRVRHRVTPAYLYAFFQSPNYWEQITHEKEGTGQPNVNGRKLANIRVPVPPLPTQRRIVAYLDELQAKVDALRALQAETQAELDALLPSVLDKAFRGEL